MNTKEAIKVVENCKSMHANDLLYGEDAAYDSLKRRNKVLDKVIECLERGEEYIKKWEDFKKTNNRYLMDIHEALERGEKYENMWNELRDKLNNLTNKEILHINGEDCRDEMNKLMNKIFPERR